MGYTKPMKIVSYLRDTWFELKQVRWPTREQTVNLTVLVIAISLIVAVYVGALDLTFTKILSLVFI